MKEVKSFIIAEVIICILKVLGGVLCNSYTMLASSIFELALIIMSLIVCKNKENKKYKGIITSVLGILMILSGLGIIFVANIMKIKRVSFWIILFVIICVFIKYIVSCFYTNSSYQKKKGLLIFSNVNSNFDFYNYGVILGVLVLSKLSKFISILKYADRLGTLLVAGLVVFLGIKIIKNSFSYLENKELEVDDDYKQEITDRKEIKKLVKLEVINYGGIRYAVCNIELSKGITLLDVNSFVITLQDYLLKIADVIKINLVESGLRNKLKVRSNQNARNSGSGNSKTNTKKKNTKKKNKKR